MEAAMTSLSKFSRVTSIMGRDSQTLKFDL